MCGKAMLFRPGYKNFCGYAAVRMRWSRKPSKAPPENQSFSAHRGAQSVNTVPSLDAMSITTDNIYWKARSRGVTRSPDYDCHT